MTSRSIIHVIADPVSAALLNVAGLGIPICLRDDLSCGPVLDFSDANRWSLRQQFWGEQSERGPRDVKDDFEELLKSEDALRSCSRIRLWVGSSVQEHLTLLWSVAALTHLQVDLSKLDMVYLDHDPANGQRMPFLRVVSEKGYRIAANMASAVSDSLLRECQQAWQAVTQPTPAGLQSLPRGGSVDASVILSRVRYLRFLYRSISTGLNIIDRELLARCKSRGPKESRILGESLGAQWETIITHTDPVTVPGWSGAGYIILDQDTGAGAFKIAGGQNGGFLKWVDDHAIPLLLLGIVLGAFDTPLIFAIGVILAAVTAIAAIYVFYEESLDNQCSPLFWLFAGIGVGFALFALVAGAGFGFVVALALYGFIASEAVKAAANSSICKNSPPPPADEGF